MVYKKIEIRDLVMIYRIIVTLVIEKTSDLTARSVTLAASAWEVMSVMAGSEARIPDFFMSYFKISVQYNKEILVS